MLKEYYKHVKKVLAKLYKASLSANISKCKFKALEVKYLGMIIRKDSIRIDPEKVAAIK